MVRRMTRAFTWLAAALVAVPAAGVGAQEMSRYRVLIPNFEALEGANKKFGENVAKELRVLLDELATHQPIEKKEMEDNLKKFKMKMEELDCIRTRQLASQMNAQVALCASYSGTPQSYTVNAEFWDIASGESLKVDPTTGAEKQELATAQHIFNAFDKYVQQVRFTQFCNDYAQSQQWDNALRNCDQALELNPSAVGTRFRRARILFEAERFEESLDELKRVLELNQFHEDAMQMAGFISAKLGQDDQAMAYYQQYLELNPGNAQIRMRVAYDLAQGGDPAGAIKLIQTGLDVNPDDVNLNEMFGGFAFAAGLEANQKAGTDANGSLSPEATDFFRRAIQAYGKVYAAKGAETPVAHLRNIAAAHIQLKEYDQAIAVAERALQTHADEVSLWSVYADALQPVGRLDEALTALNKVKELNPTYPGVAMRQATWLVLAGRTDEAVRILRTAVQDLQVEPDVAAGLLFSDAYANGVNKQRYAYAISGIGAAKQIPNVSSKMTSQLNFWHAFSLYMGAVAEQEPQNIQTARATLPKFQQAIELFPLAREYAATQQSINLSQFIQNAQTYVEIQEAIIKRGR